MKKINDAEWFLIVKILKKEYTEQEWIDFHNWLEQQESNKDIYNVIKTDWERSGNISVKSHSNPELVWENILRRINQQEALKRGSSTKTWFKVAAAITILIVASILLVNNKFSSGGNNYAFTESFEQGVNLVMLPDSSKVWLDGQSTLEYNDFTSSEVRSVKLTGRGYFEVFRNENKPFLVSAGRSTVKVLGTAFNINARDPDKKIELTVTHGKVSFSKKEDNSSLVINNGETAVFTTANGFISKSKSQDLNVLSWKTGILTFENTDLNSICKILSNHYKSEINVSDNIPKTIYLTAKFDNQSLEEVLQVVTTTLNLSLTKENNIYYLN